MLSDSPPERDLPWSEAGIEGCWRFVQRLWRLFGQYDAAATGEDKSLDRKTHQTVAAVAGDIEALGFNKAVARIYELTGATEKAAPSASRSQAIRSLLLLVAPMMPHLAEEVYARLYPGSDGIVAELPWPEADAGLAAAELVTIAVQVLGKLRGTISMPPGSAEEDVLVAAAAETNVARLLEGKRIVKRVYVPNRIVNFVIAG